MLELTSKIDTLCNRKNVAHADRRNVVSGAVVLAVAYSLPLPSGEIEVLNSYYLDTIKPIVAGKVSKINESIVIDVPAVMEATWNLWKARYRAVYEPRSSEAADLARSCFTQQTKGTLGDLDAIVAMGQVIDGYVNGK